MLSESRTAITAKRMTECTDYLGRGTKEEKHRRKGAVRRRRLRLGKRGLARGEKGRWQGEKIRGDSRIEGQQRKEKRHHRTFPLFLIQILPVAKAFCIVLSNIFSQPHPPWTMSYFGALNLKYLSLYKVAWCRYKDTWLPFKIHYNGKNTQPHLQWPFITEAFSH